MLFSIPMKYEPSLLSAGMRIRCRLSSRKTDPFLGLSGLPASRHSAALAFDWGSYLHVPYYVTASWRENLGYDEMTLEEQGLEADDLDRYASRFGSIPPERAASFVEELLGAGVSCRLTWPEGGQG